MTVTTPKSLTFEQFLAQYPEEQGVYELVDGKIVEMRATRNHDDIVEFLDRQFYREIERLNLGYVVKRNVVVQTFKQDGTVQGRNPDVSVVERRMWRANRSDYSALREPIPLAVEIVSTNWQDDYIDKLGEYQRLGIAEYWIVDYLALASAKYLGKPKIPTIFVYLLAEDGKYYGHTFTGSDRIVSRLFPELTLTVAQIVNA